MANTLYQVIRLIRMREWVKNLFLFIPIFFAGNLFDFFQLIKIGLGAVAFSFTASGVYVMNDYKDRDVDRQHPQKKNRPIASGLITESLALAIMIVLMLGGLLISFFISISFFYLLLVYLALNLLYSNGLKNVPILDLFIVAFGFSIRVYSGGTIADVPVSHWLSIMILLLALFLVIAKRRDDLIIYSRTGEMVRVSSRAYNLEFINSCLTLLSAVIIVAYIMYTLSPEVAQRFKSDYLFSTTIFVIAGVMRYLQIIFVESDSASPTSILYKDKFILITIVSWIITFYVIIYALGRT